MAAVTKRKRISKRNKSAWRKTDIQDVDEFLEEQRLQERIGSFADKSDDALFTVEATPQKPKRSVLTEKQKRKLNAQKPHRSLESLVNKSKVQDPITKRNHVKLKKSGRIIEEEVRNPTKPRHFQANKDRAKYYEKLEEASTEEKGPKANKDIWADEDFRDKIPGLKDKKGWISRDLSLYITKNVGKPVIKVHGSIRNRTIKSKGFDKPDPGISYNPSLEDHQALINTVVQKEEKIIKEKSHLKRVTTEMFQKLTPEERDARRRREMKADAEDEEDEEDSQDSEIADSEDEAPYNTINPPVENKKKSRQTRRKVTQQKELQKKHDEKKALKKQIADLNRIKSIKAEVVAEEEELNVLKKHRKKVELNKKFDTKRLGRLKFEDPDIDVNMPEDIAGNLRNVKPESSLLIDRFKNFQKRNILPVSVATGKQKAPKIKRFQRNTHKDPGVSFQMLREKRKAALKKV